MAANLETGLLQMILVIAAAVALVVARSGGAAEPVGQSTN
jgi:hypothetical protein